MDIANITKEIFSKNDSIVSVENEDNEEMYIKTIDNFKKIKIGDSKASVIKRINKPNRIDKSEYNFNWYIYDKEKFVMIGIKIIKWWLYLPIILILAKMKEYVLIRI